MDNMKREEKCEELVFKPVSRLDNISVSLLGHRHRRASEWAISMLPCQAWVPEAGICPEDKKWVSF